MSGRGISDNGMVMYGVPPIDQPTIPPIDGTNPWGGPFVSPPAPPEPLEKLIQRFVNGDPELAAIAQIVGAMAQLDDAARKRVADYVSAKWGSK